jgi:NADH dehydrogenase FAD-containing subunit
MGRHLVLVGGGHAHMTVLFRLGDFTGRGHRVTVINPSPYLYYSGMGSGMLAGIYEPREVRFHIRKMAEERGASFIEDKAARIIPEHRIIRLASGREVPYDVASFNTGSEVQQDLLAAPLNRIFPVKPIINLYRARLEILHEIGQREVKIIVMGGGLAGVEISANIWRLLLDKPHSAEITLVGSRNILEGLPDRARRLALDSLKRRNIQVMEGIRVNKVGTEEVFLSDGNALPYDFAFAAMGVSPSTLFRDSGLPTGEDGGLLVNSFLQSTAHPELFGGGDCITMNGTPLAKVGVYAVRQNTFLYRNLRAGLEGGTLQPFQRGGNYMLIMNMGDGSGILWRKNHVWDGRFAFLIKDFIDRRYMKTYQVSGERDETNGEEEFV